MKENNVSEIEISSIESVIPVKEWFHLREACELKNLNYKTACNRRELQPNRGISEGLIGGRKCFKRSTVLLWIKQTDIMIMDSV